MKNTDLLKIGLSFSVALETASKSIDNW